MERLRYYIRLWLGYQRIGVMVMVQYPSDTFLWITSMLLREAAGFLGVMTVANIAGGLGSWSVPEICVLYGMCAIIEAIGQAFFDNIWDLGNFIRKGQLDVQLVRPASPLVQVFGQCCHYQAVVSMVVYVSVLVYGLWALHIGPGIGLILFFAEYIICAALINSGIYTLFNSLNFWLVQGDEISVVVQTVREFAKYPLGVFPKMIQGFLTFIIPFGFVGYYPASFVTGKEGLWVVWALPAAALVMVGITSLVWRAGLNSYNSTGT